MKSEMPGMKEGESKYGWYAKMYVKMLFGLLSLPFMFLILLISIPIEEINLWRHYGVGKVEFGKPGFNGVSVFK